MKPDRSSFNWLDDQNPHCPARAAAQIAAVLKLLDPAPKHIIDLGCGLGRVLVELVAAGHVLIGIDHNQTELDHCHTSLKTDQLHATLIHADFLADAFPPPELKAQSFDAVMCLGNTFMTITNVLAGVRLLKCSRSLLKPRGMFIIDNFPFQFRAELTDGNWLTGISEDNSMQLIWQPGDDVLTLRTGKQVDREDWEIHPHDEKVRVWSIGELTLAATLAGLSAPQHLPDEGLLIMRPA